MARFLKNGRLTEDNLRNLDTKISKEANLRDKRDAILGDHKSNAGSIRSRASSHAFRRAGSAAVADDTRSNRSVASSRRSSQPMSIRSQRRGADEVSRTSSYAAKSEVFSELAEEDEWTAIQKFNTLLHYEEQK